jgi:hypothetical protein
VAATKERRVVFSWDLENKALKTFFGDTRGSYLAQNGLMTDQMLDLFEIDYAATGHTISEMPPLGDGTFLDVGYEWHSEYPNDTGALILSPNGKLQAAAIFWQQSNVPVEYRTGPVFLTIFIKDNRGSEQAKKRINILENFGQLAYQTYRGSSNLLPPIRGASQWSIHPVKVSVPTNIVYLNVR